MNSNLESTDRFIYMYSLLNLVYFTSAYIGRGYRSFVLNKLTPHHYTVPETNLMWWRCITHVKVKQLNSNTCISDAASTARPDTSSAHLRLTLLRETGIYNWRQRQLVPFNHFLPITNRDTNWLRGRGGDYWSINNTQIWDSQNQFMTRYFGSWKRLLTLFSPLTKYVCIRCYILVKVTRWFLHLFVKCSHLQNMRYYINNFYYGTHQRQQIFNAKSNMLSFRLNTLFWRKLVFCYNLSHIFFWNMHSLVICYGIWDSRPKCWWRRVTVLL